MTLGVIIIPYASVLSPETGEGYVFISKILFCAIRFPEVLLQRDVEVARLQRVITYSAVLPGSQLVSIHYLIFGILWHLCQRVTGSW